MHEITYAMALIEGVENAVRERDGGRISRVKVKLGLARGIRPEALRAAFDWIKPDTIVRGATLDIEVMSITVRCTLCNQAYVTEEILGECPHCGALGGEVLSGDEFTITRVEIEEFSLAGQSPIRHLRQIGYDHASVL
jgi:hydrogenase nickel incorporation protein HypA/HybF